MLLERLVIDHFRNFKRLALDFDKRCTLIVGNNGSGKTSVLEAIYYAIVQRSFRTNTNHRLIQENQESFQIYMEFLVQEESHKLGLMRHRSQDSQMRLDGQNHQGAAAIVAYLPCILLVPESFKLLTEGSMLRRKWLDWGCCYEDPQFIQHWRRANALLNQRNSALKAQASKAHIQAWDQAYITAHETVLEHRRRYLETITPQIANLICNFGLEYDIDLQCYGGWPAELSLAEALEQSLEKDRHFGFSQYGAHRMDVRIKKGTVLARESLSRGQQKLIICAMKLAQGLQLSESHQRKVLFLLDDISAELDGRHFEKILAVLERIQGQVIATAIDASHYPSWQDHADTMQYPLATGQMHQYV